MKEVIVLCVLIAVVCTLMDKLTKRLGWRTATEGTPKQNQKSILPQGHKNRVLCTSYSVKGKNPTTNRAKTVSVIVESTATETEIHQKSGLLPPYEIMENPLEKPTEKQIAYAKKMNFSFPPDATIRDASIFLTRLENGMPLYPFRRFEGEETPGEHEIPCLRWTGGNP